MSDDHDFITSLEQFPSLKRHFEFESNKIKDSVDREFSSQQSELVKKKLDGIEIDIKHRRIWNACIFPFSVEDNMLSSLGYYFYKASPLAEKEEKNFDFLIISNKSRKKAIFGEVKSSTENQASIIAETKERISIVKRNRDYIINTYLNQEEYEFEYVLCVSWEDASEMAKTIIRKGGGIILWQVGLDLHSNVHTPKLSLFKPIKQDGGLDTTMRHCDEELNKALKNINTSMNYKTFFVQSHPVTKMLILLSIDKNKSNGEFCFNDILRRVQQELDYADEDTQQKEAKYILECAILVNFIQEKDGKLKIHSRYKNAKGREEDLRKKWIDYKINEEKKRKIAEKIEILKNKIKKDLSMQKKIDEYGNR